MSARALTGLQKHSAAPPSTARPAFSFFSMLFCQGDHHPGEKKASKKEEKATTSRHWPSPSWKGTRNIKVSGSTPWASGGVGRGLSLQGLCTGSPQEHVCSSPAMQPDWLVGERSGLQDASVRGWQGWNLLWRVPHRRVERQESHPAIPTGWHPAPG